MRTAELVQLADTLTHAMRPTIRAQIASAVLAQLAAARAAAFGDRVSHDEMQEDAETAVDYANHLLRALDNPHLADAPDAGEGIGHE